MMNQAQIQLPYSYCFIVWRIVMDQREIKPQVAQPAEEEIKKHGDQLARQVRDAAGKPPEEQHVKPDNSSED
jgi:ferritin-like protein